MEALTDFISKTGFMLLLDNWKCVAMILIAAVLLYLAIVKKFEPMLLIPIAFGMLLVNLPGSAMIDPPSEANNNVGGLFYYLSYGVEYGIYPTLIFLGVGAMTDFGPLIANPKSLLLGAAAQFGIFIAFFLALLLGFSPEAAASIGIIGGADGPTTIFTTARFVKHDNDSCILLYGACSVHTAAYNARVDDQEGKKHSHVTASSCFKTGKDYFSDCCHSIYSIASAFSSSIARNAHVW